MYEDQTYEEILRRMLRRVTDTDKNLDTREGSVVWLGQAPAAVELQNLYLQLDNILTETFASTASREYLLLRAGERGFVPYSANSAVWKLQVTPDTIELPMNTRFSIGELNYAVTDNLGGGAYELTCETAGEAGNDCSDAVIPIDYIEGLESCTVTEMLIAGRDEEETETFRSRFLDSFNSQAFGGNQSDYQEKVNAISGVGGVKVYRAWNRNLRPTELKPPDGTEEWLASLSDDVPSEIRSWLSKLYSAGEEGLLTVGGTVKLVIMASNNTAPSETLLEEVQEAVDPVESTGEGMGLAPIGHVVTVTGVKEVPVDLSLNLTYATGWGWAAAKSYVAAAIDGYFDELKESWANVDFLTVRISQIESRILTECATMVADIGDTRINGQSANLILDGDSIPVRGGLNG